MLSLNPKCSAPTVTWVLSASFKQYDALIALVHFACNTEKNPRALPSGLKSTGNTMADTASYPSLSSNEQGRIKGSIAAVWSLAIITVVLRFSSRRLSKAGFWYDDWLLLPAIVCFAHYSNSALLLLSNHVISSLPRLYLIRQVSGVLQPFVSLCTGALRLKWCPSDKSWPRKRFVHCLTEWY